jgi:hypothetical protein
VTKYLPSETKKNGLKKEEICLKEKNPVKESNTFFQR